jgi:hypothetical protein
MKVKNITGCVLFVIASVLVNGCCNMSSSKKRLGERLDASDLQGAIQEINNPCTSKIPNIRTTKALLIYKQGMMEKKQRRQQELKEEALAILRQEAAAGNYPAVDIVESYSKLGEVYFLTFPWGGILGPSMPPGQDRTY